MERTDLIVIGAGQAGLATAFAARAAGLDTVVLEASDGLAGSWPTYYDSLTLFSPARYSALLGLPFPGDPEHYPARDEVIEYLTAYAGWLGADIRLGQRVERVVAGGDDLLVQSADGSALAAPRVICATGGFGSPHRPALPGLATFPGTVLHSSEYRSPERFAGGRVLVVGAGNSAVQIATELAATARVSLATRSPLRWFPQRPLGRDVHWWLARSGLDGAPVGRLLGGHAAPVLDDGRYRAAVAQDRPDRRAMFTGMEGEEVLWPDGARERVDAVILATGYRPHVPFLAGTGALGAGGEPLHRGGISTALPGLGYVGLEYQRSFASATLRGVCRDAAYALARLAPASARAPRRRPRCCAAPVAQ